MSQSLTKRLFLSAGTVIFAFLALTALVLNQAFTSSLESIVREKLRVHTYSLLALADFEGGQLKLPRVLAEPRFNTSRDPLIALVSDKKQNEHWRSISAEKQKFTLPFPEAGQWLFGRAQDTMDREYFVSSYSTVWPDEFGKKTTFIFTVMETTEHYQIDVEEYRNRVLLALLIAGLILLALQAIILRWGLKPVRGLAADVDAMSRGDSISLGGDYPRELKTLVRNVNLLIENERRQRERYRERMADLSHSLKTPLSVLKGLETDLHDPKEPLDVHTLQQSLGRQTEKMRGIIDYQLRRAVSSGQNMSMSAIHLEPELIQILDALDKVYADKQVLAELEIEDQVAVLMDPGDLAEVLGNLLDNAYKHCRHKVMTLATVKSQSNGPSRIFLTVEDDGSGIPAAKRRSILQRGVRLDTSVEGQGFGLSIVGDIIGTYRGSITIGESPLGGALFTLELPGR
jgi:two-component system sensor histidine kinase PhoQ